MHVQVHMRMRMFSMGQARPGSRRSASHAVAHSWCRSREGQRTKRLDRRYLFCSSSLRRSSLAIACHHMS